MWARVVEFMLGCWLAISPFVFQHGDQRLLWIVDWTVAAFVVSFSALAWWGPTRHSRWATLAVAIVLILIGRFAGGGGEMPTPGFQNHILTGLLLLMFAIVPNHASHPPAVWADDQPG